MSRFDDPETIASGLREQAERMPEDGPAVVSTARLRALNAAEMVAGALARDPTLAEREQRNLDLLAEIMRRLVPLARQVSNAAEFARLSAAGQAAAHLGRINPDAADKLDHVSARCQVIAAKIEDAVLPDWDTPRRIRELSSMRMPAEYRLAEIADALRSSVAHALDLPHPDPEAVRLAGLADQISARG